MSEESKKQSQSGEVGRREFVGFSVAAGMGASALSAEAADNIVETDVEIKTPDGTCDAAFIHPKSGSHPAVILWPDAFGLRPSMRDMAKRLAADGYSVLVPNPFYRLTKPPFTDASNVDFAKDRAKITPLMASIGADGAAEKDAAAFVEFFDKQKVVNKKKKIGVQGYCMGGPLVVRTAASLPDRIGAGGSFHGGGLVTPNANSPHLLAPKIKAKMYFGIANSDDKNSPTDKDKLKEAFIAAHNPAEIEVYTTCVHGWCVPDMPKQANGDSTYNKAEAERAWGKLTALYKANIA
ncbi:MAG TPA: dienelactone hydrolase family protein [Bryobacteraceae bacterium]|nr:dienelactone hydrolase family protein [Bryobacteraceae bacterium]